MEVRLTKAIQSGLVKISGVLESADADLLARHVNLADQIVILQADGVVGVQPIADEIFVERANSGNGGDEKRDPDVVRMGKIRDRQNQRAMNRTKRKRRAGSDGVPKQNGNGVARSDGLLLGGVEPNRLPKIVSSGGEIFVDDLCVGHGQSDCGVCKTIGKAGDFVVAPQVVLIA